MNLQLVYRYILSLSKNESMFYEKYKKKQKDQKKKEKSITKDKYWTQDLQQSNSTHYLLRHESQHRMRM